MGNKKENYIYAVARVRCKEANLLSAKSIEQLISMKDSQSVERYLRELGWGSAVDYGNIDILSSEQDSLWCLMKELVGDLSAFDFLRIQNDYHNIKASVKAVYSGCDVGYMLLSGSVYDPELIYKAVRDKDYKAMPEPLCNVAQQAMNTLLRTGDGQLCDTIIDKACLMHISSLGKVSDNELIRKYCEIFVASGNIRIAVRCSTLKKSSDFILRCVAECESLDIKALASSAVKGLDAVCNYLSSTDYKNAVVYIKESLSAFEKWCDNYMMELMRSQKSEPFSIGPLVAYILAKQTEIKAVRLILTAKLNSLPDSIIRERIRELYV